MLDYEKKQLVEAPRPDLAEKVTHIAAVEGDGAGYDILSFSPDGKKKYVELKTTEGAAETDFFVTANEVEFSRNHPDDYYLYRVHGYDPVRNSGQFYNCVGPLSNSLELIPTQFRARVRRS